MDESLCDDVSALAAKRSVLAQRALALRAIRRFFETRDFLEVETPVRLSAPALELHIDAEPAGGAYLRTSPELHMKRLLAAGYERIYQMGPCFRRGECGPRHHPEFTMLEWYRAGADSEAMLRDTVDLVRAVSAALPASGPAARVRPAVEGIWVRLTVSEAFRRWAGWDPAETWDADRFDLDLVDRVEPQLPRDVPVVLSDYPAPAAALARLRPDHPAVAERWELYLGGLEIANAYTELTDPDEQRRRFEQCARERRALGKAVYPVDESFLAALAAGMPPSGGIALGVDRLVMALTGAPTMDAVRAFGAERLP